MLQTYNDLVARVNDLGVMAFYGKFVEHFPRLEDETEPQSWNSDDLSRNPWYWKDRACESKDLAFGNLLGGCKGFLSRDLYGLFYSAYRPRESMAALYKAGKIPALCKRVYEKIELEGCISSSALKAALVPGDKTGGRQVSAALAFLQATYFISVTGGVQRVSKDGTPYGWPALQYSLTEQWAEGWYDTEACVPRETAVKAILAHCKALNEAIDMKRLKTKLFAINKLL